MSTKLASRPPPARARRTNSPGGAEVRHPVGPAVRGDAGACRPGRGPGARAGTTGATPTTPCDGRVVGDGRRPYAHPSSGRAARPGRRGAGPHLVQRPPRVLHRRRVLGVAVVPADDPVAEQPDVEPGAGGRPARAGAIITPRPDPGQAPPVDRLEVRLRAAVQHQHQTPRGAAGGLRVSAAPACADRWRSGHGSANPGQVSREVVGTAGQDWSMADPVDPAPVDPPDPRRRPGPAGGARGAPAAGGDRRGRPVALLRAGRPDAVRRGLRRRHAAAGGARGAAPRRCARRTRRPRRSAARSPRSSPRSTTSSG